MQLRPLRVLSGLAVLTLWSALHIAAARALPSTALGVLLGVTFTVPLISLWEWITHGVLYHRAMPGMREIFKIHVGGHHLALFPPQQYFRQGTYSFMRFREPRTPWVMSDNLLDSALTSGAQVGLHFVIGIPFIVLPAWLASGNTTFSASVLGTLAVISYLLAYVHGVIHNPQGRWVERQRWFQWLDRHHYIHHVDMTANVNFLLPLCDVLLGTRKAALTPEEAARVPSFEQAKPLAWDVRHAATRAR